MMNKNLHGMHIKFVASILMASFAPLAIGSSLPFVAPGLWRIVSDVHGPMQQHSRMTKEECLNLHDGSDHETGLPGAAGGSGVTTQVINSTNRSTVHLSSIVNMPNGTMTQDVVQVFTVTNPVLHRATMTGHGSLKFTSSPIMDETFTQQGMWLSPSCPAVLPATKTETLQGSTMPALDALKSLSQQPAGAH
ncbi:MAG: hypothetical protein ACYC0M_04045 [Burkholderiales bacterium]